MTMSCCCVGTLENIEVAVGNTSRNGFVYCYEFCITPRIQMELVLQQFCGCYFTFELTLVSLL
jgi:hypothetical protein